MEDPIVSAVKELYESRSQLGLLKYGTTLADNPLDLAAWLLHLQTELMDAVLYIERARREVVARGQ